MMAAPASILTPAFSLLQRCDYCSKWRLPSEMMRFGADKCMAMCHNCYQRHEKAMQMLSGLPAEKWGCQECGVSAVAIRERSHDGNCRLYVHWKDGIYEILCRPCSDAYEKKRLDLYGNTPYGWKRKLKGNK